MNLNLLSKFNRSRNSVDLVRKVISSPQSIPLNSAISNNYNFAICDSSVSFPFQLSKELLYRALVFQKLSQTRRAYAIFDYLCNTITYGSEKRRNGYAMSTEVWKNRQGVCGEMSYLYVSLARFCGLQSNYVSVTRDYKGKKVCHACASVKESSFANPKLVDISYKLYDVHHLKYEHISDESAWSLFRSWR